MVKRNSPNTDNRKFYRLLSDLRNMSFSDYLMHGYESEQDYREAILRLHKRWHDRVGECVDERHGFLLLRFHDTLGGIPDQCWLPKYLLQQAPMPDYMSTAVKSDYDKMEEELNRIFGFD